MKQDDEYVDPLQRFINDHKDVSEQLDILEKVMGFLISEEAWSQIKPVEEFFKQHLVEHFKFEEKAIFAPLLARAAKPDVIELILELQREHGCILNELNEFKKIVEKGDFPLDEDSHKKLNVIGRDIISSLLAHASKEDDLLLPILKENIHIFAKHDVV
jgi:iron-sulfur cluster repair protein YtfE (RIC family)